ncbi:MAG: JAB domain-containing protein [Halanaerobiales bacterium]|nr:JAB domain-containing protein [Halanaerobiales bacterium]
MTKLNCTHCGGEIQKQDLLGIGTFDKNIGKYAGQTVVLFRCNKCHQKEYQVVDLNPFEDIVEITLHLELSSEEVFLAKREPSINCNDQLDFYESIQQISSVEEFLVKCNLNRFEKMTHVGQFVQSPTDVYNLFVKFNGLDKKRMMIFFLDEESRLITWELLGEGTNKRISYDPKLVFRTAMLLPKKASIILAHNHLNHLSNPSKKDILRTKRLVSAGEVLDVDFLDHVIILQEGFKSFEQLNLL